MRGPGAADQKSDDAAHDNPCDDDAGDDDGAHERLDAAAEVVEEHRRRLGAAHALAALETLSPSWRKLAES